MSRFALSGFVATFIQRSAISSFDHKTLWFGFPESVDLAFPFQLSLAPLTVVFCIFWSSFNHLGPRDHSRAEQQIGLFSLEIGIICRRLRCTPSASFMTSHRSAADLHRWQKWLVILGQSTCWWSTSCSFSG
jgi:hypothetical protein